MKGSTAVKGMTFHAFHGSLEVERELGQVFSVDVILGFDLSPKDASESTEQQVRGVAVYDLTKNVMMGTRFKSHVSLALRLAQEMFQNFKTITDVRIAIGRRQLFIAGDVREIVAEVDCKREDFEHKG